MYLLRNLLLIMLSTILIQSSFGGTSKEAKPGTVAEESEDKKAVADNSFEKRQGFAFDMEEDQIAMESQVHDQVAVESAPKDQMAVESNNNNRIQVQQAHGQEIPVPFPIRGVPQSIVFPMPPQGFQQQQPGPIMGMRAPPPHQGKHVFQQGHQGQFSNQHPSRQVPPPSFFKQQQQQGGGGVQHFLQQNPTQVPQRQLVSTPAGDLVIHKATEFSIGGNSAERQQQKHSGEMRSHQNPIGLVPPLPHQQGQKPRFLYPQQQQQQVPQRQQGLSSSEITKNIIRELFDKKPPGMTDGRPNGGFFSAPQNSQESIPKVLNRPQGSVVPNANRPGGVPIVSGGNGLFSSGKELALSTNDLNAEGGEIVPSYGDPGSFQQGGDRDGSSWPSGPDGDTPKIVSLEVKCEKNVMRVFVAFDKPFFGVIFSKGHYHNVNCIHLPAGLGHTSANFDVGIDACGTQGNTENGLYGYGVQSGSGSYFENTVVIQYDSQVQEVWDQARKLRCTWHDQYEKSVTFRPFPVDMLDVVRADFAGDNVGCWMQIQVGKGPWASEVSGLVKIGQTMTMVLAIKDDDNKFDMMVRNCLAHDGQRAPIQLVDQWGCITRPKLMSPFTKIKNFGASATVLSYAHFQAFKFPDSMEVHFQCTIQICRHQCPEQCTQGGQGGYGGIGKSGLPAPGDRDDSARRKRRAANATMDNNEDEVFEYQTTFKADFSSDDVGLNKVITVVSPDDLDFNSDSSSSESGDEGVPIIESNGNGDIVCMSTLGFAAMITLLIGLLLVACIISAVIVLKKRPRSRKGHF